jgi:hypothetical protein
MAIGLALPTVGGSSNTWGSTLNTALTQLNTYDLFARKTASQALPAVTLVDDNALSLSMTVVSSVYLVQWSLRTDGLAAADFRYSFVGPTGATMTWSSLGLDVAATTIITASTDQDAPLIGTNVLHGTIAVGTTSRVEGTGLLIMSTNTGVFKMQVAQGTGNATASNILLGSWMLARQVA